MNKVEISFKLLDGNAKLPTKGKDGDAAYDLYCIEKVIIYPGETVKVRTGLQLAYMTPEQGDDLLYLQIKGRSGVSSKGVYPLGGVVDATYRGEIQVILHNGNRRYTLEDVNGWMGDKSISGMLADFNASKVITFNPGDRIAQFVITRTPKCVDIRETDLIIESTRGSSGFGSTGV